MQESFDRMGGSQEIRLISEAIINLYAAHVHSLLYPYDHPLISDSLRNAFHCLQRALQKKTKIRLDIYNGKPTVEGEELKGDAAIQKNFASWLNSRNIKALSFTSELTRREIINFHRLISTMKNLTFEELSNAMSEKGITGIIVHPLELSEAYAEADTIGNTADQPLCKDYVSTMFHKENSQAQTPFFLRPEGTGPLDEAANYGVIRDYAGTIPPSENSEVSPSFSADSDAKDDDRKKMMEGARYAECVEALLEHDISEEARSVVRHIPAPDMAHLLNAMLFRPPDRTVAGRIIEAYFGEIGEAREDSVERYEVFLTRLKADLRPIFEAECASFFETGSLPDSIQNTNAGGIREVACPPAEQAGFIPCRTLETSDFIFDFIANGNGVFHDIEISAETAKLFNKSSLTHFLNEDSSDRFPSANQGESDEDGSPSAIIEECMDDAIADASFDVMLELLESTSLDGVVYRKLEEKLAAFIELFSEKGEFEKVLEIFNSLKTQSLQGRWEAHASAMIRSIFSSDRLNARIMEALRQYGRKQKEGASKLARALKSYLVPYLLDALGEETDTSKRRFMMTLLTSARSDALQHIGKRLHDSRWYVLRNMLYLLRECRGTSYAQEVKEFLEHQVPLVRLEALRTLLSFQDPDANSYVIKFLGSDISQLQRGAVRLAGAFRIRYAMPHLVRLLQEKDILGKKFLFKRGIIRALGRIGDSHAIGYLLEICRSKSVLHKDEFDKLKIEIFRTLHNYPAAKIKPFIDFGIRSANEEIVAVSKKLIKRYRLSTEKTEETA